VTTQPQYYHETFLAILIATLICLVLSRRQRKQRSYVSPAQVSITFGAAMLTALVFLFSLPFVVRQAGLEPNKWMQQAIQVASAVIAYFVAGYVLARLRKPGS
jgi:putative flippase GtrA